MGLGRAIFGDRITEGGEKLALPGEPPVEVLLKPSKRSRRLSLRVSRLDGRVTLTVPFGVARREAEGFLTEKADWIRGHLSSVPDEAVPMPGGHVLFEGREVPILASRQRGVRIGPEGIEVPEAGSEATPARLAGFLKERARARLVDASERYATQVGRPMGRVTLRDTRSRWGSCSHEGNLMYSWRLIMAPPEVLDYVAAHEVSHLVHMDHSTAFWAQVEAIFPNHRPARKWLKDEGGRLHRYRFRD